MPLPLNGADLIAYNNLPAIPSGEPLGNLLNSLTGNNAYDASLLSELTSIDAVATRYFGSTGSDVTGNGSAAAPYREMQRCLDSIPPDCQGSLNFVALDAGPFRGFSAHDLKAGRASLVVTFVGAGASVLNIPALPVGSRDANGAGGDKVGHWKHNVGAHPALTAASHWLKGAFDAGGGNFWYVGLVLDHENSPSPNLSIVSETDYSTLGYDHFDLVPYTSVLAGANYYGSLLLHSVPQRNGALITVAGFTTTEYLIVQGSNIYLDAVANTDATKQIMIVSDQPNGTLEQYCVHNAGRTIVKGVDGASCGLTGLFYKTVDLMYVSCHMNGACRAVAADTYSIAIGRFGELGVHGGGQLTTNVDFEGNVDTNIYCRKGEVRLYDDGSQPTTDGAASHFIYAEHASQIVARDDAVACVMGSTAGVCVTIATHSHTRGLLGHGSAPALRNTVTPGNDVVVGADATPVTFASLPHTDVGVADPHFCRAA